MAASNLNLGKASGGVLNVQPADGTTTTSLVLPAINGTVVAADSNGNVGIGVSDPDRKLEVYSNVPSIKISDSNAKSGTQGSIGKLEFSQHYGTITSSSIEGYQDGTATDYQKGGLKFLTNNGTTLNEAMRIDINGNVGIGTVPSVIGAGKGIDLGTAGGFYGDGLNYTWNTQMTQNAYPNSAGGHKYKVNGIGASAYIQTNNNHSWYIAGAGTAGNAITWTNAMTLGLRRYSR